MQIVVRLDTRECGITELARLPQKLALSLCRCSADIGRAVLLEDPQDRRRPVFDLLAESLDLDEQQRPSIRGEVDVERGIQRADRDLVEHLHRCGHHAGCDDRARRTRPTVDVGKDRDERAHVLRKWQ